MSNRSFSKSCRLLTPEDYKPVFDKPDFRINSPEILLLVRRNTLVEPRLGLVVAKKQIKFAHRRNRAKRILRESFRHQEFNFSVDIVVLVRQKADLMDNKQLFEHVDSQWTRLARKMRQHPDS